MRPFVTGFLHSAWPCRGLAMLSNVSVLHSLPWPNNKYSVAYRYHILFICLLTDGRMCHFCLSATVKNASVNIRTQAFVPT